MTDDQRASTRLHHFAGRTIELPTHLSEAQLDGRACVHCGHPPELGGSMRPVEAWSEQSAQLFECVDTIACHARIRASEDHQ
jgi:Zn ribbon nucleic-acid-binding protein